jgi:class 3 adenylate cyclase/tetratricopeptide (TPR) repeat protein
MPICPDCGQENPAMGHFCLACAAPLSEVPLVRDERKVVTVLFSDLVGFTARVERMDPEDVRAFVAPYWRHVRGELVRHGGTVEKYVGDAVMALFGAPVAHEDDPERAVRAALAIRDWAREQEEIRVRIAVNTGEALVRIGAEPLAGEGMAAGDVVNTASRLQTAAPANGILIGESTYRATRDVIECRQVEPVEAKGKTKRILVWEAVQARSRLGVGLMLRARTPLVGRDRELELLQSALARVREERSPQLVTLVGMPGIGKSRLVYELMRAVEAEPELVTWRQGRSLPYGEGVSFWALAEIVKAQAGILETDADEEAERKLADAVENVVGDAAEARWIERHLRLLVGLAGEEALPLGDRRDEAFAAWRRFFEAIAARHPLVLVFENLHWADEGMFDFVDHLVEWASGVALLVVGTTRPELLERRPGWGGSQHNALTISLSPLSDDETTRLIAGLLNRPLLSAETQAELLVRAGGNPLFAEQYVRVLAERADGEQLRLPESVQGLIAARLDALAPEEKSLLQDAAVVGEVFWLGAVVALGGLEHQRAQELLHELERKQFVRRGRRSSLAAETEYVFGHVLVREVAYGQMTRARRAETHVFAAEWLTSVIGDRGDHVEVLADHYTRALELRRASGAATMELERSARTALQAAGDRALAVNAFDAAVTFYRQALELWPIEDSLRAKALFGYGRALRWAEDGGADPLIEARDALIAAGDRESAAEAAVLLFELTYQRDTPEPGFAHLTRAAELVGDLGPSPSKAYVLSSLARYHAFQDQEADAIRLGRQALGIAEELGLEDIRAHALNYIGMARVNSGDLAGLSDLEGSVAIARTISTPFSLLAYNNLAGVLYGVGQRARALELFAEGLQEARRFGVASEVEDFEEAMSTSLWVSGRWDELLRHLDAKIATRGGSRQAIPALFERAYIRAARDDARGAMEDATTALELARSRSRPHSSPDRGLLFALVFYARTLLSVGRADEARPLADELTRLLATAQPTFEWGDGWIDLAVVLTALDRTSQLVDALGRTSATPWVDAAYAYAAGDFVQAAETYAIIGSPQDEALARLRAAQALIQEGHRAEADEQLQHALIFYRAVGATRYIREGEALLATSSERQARSSAG